MMTIKVILIATEIVAMISNNNNVNYYYGKHL